jgi:hypothetical protein
MNFDENADIWRRQILVKKIDAERTPRTGVFNQKKDPVQLNFSSLKYAFAKFWKVPKKLSGT